MKKRSDGRYQIQVELGTKDGKRIRKTVYGDTQKEANKKADALKLAYGRGVKDVNLTLSQWKDAFLTKEKYKTTDTNYKAKESKLNIFQEYITDIPIIDIKPYMIEGFFSSLVSKGRSVKTIKEYKSVLNQFFSFAFINGGIISNPCDYVEMPKGKPKKQRRALTKEEQERVANLPNDIYPGKAMALLCMWAGLRRGEATALTAQSPTFLPVGLGL